MFRKTAIIIGGSGQVGTKFAERFGGTWFKRWNVINIDKTANPKCKFNFTIDFEKALDQDTIIKLQGQIRKTTEEVDAIINLAASP